MGHGASVTPSRRSSKQRKGASAAIHPLSRAADPFGARKARKHGGASQPATAARRRTRRGGQAAREARRLERGRGVVEDARQHALRVAAAAEVVHEEEGEHAQPVGGKRAPLPAGRRRGPIQGVRWQPLAGVSALSRPAAEPKAEHDERRSAQTESSHLENLGVQRLDGRRQARRLKVDCSSVPRHILRRTARPEAAEPGRTARTRLCKAVPKLLEKAGAADDVLIWSKPARNRKRWKDLEPLGCISEVPLRRGEAATGRPVHDAEPTLGVVGKTADLGIRYWEKARGQKTPSPNPHPLKPLGEPRGSVMG